MRLMLLVVLLFSQAAVPIEREPRHVTVFASGALRVFEILVPAGDTTLDHTHSYDLANVCIECSPTRTRPVGQDWGPVRPRELGSVAITEYTGQPSTHAVRNIGDGRYHLIAVENRGTAGWSTTAAVSAPATTVTEDARAFRIYRVHLMGDVTRTTHVHAMPTVVVNGTGASRGQWRVIPAGETHTVTAADAGGDVVEIELR